jgi:hypothetical protein
MDGEWGWWAWETGWRMYQIEYPNTGIKIQDGELPCGGRRVTTIGRKGTKSAMGGAKYASRMYHNSF